jgi:Homeodomain-like domain-containing protein
MKYRYAPLTPNGRRRLVALVEEEGLTFEVAAATSNVAKSTVHAWVSRWREASEEERPDLAACRIAPRAPKDCGRCSPSGGSSTGHQALLPQANGKVERL